MLGLSVIGTVASVAGVIIGVWTLVTAMGAKEAANEARWETQRRSVIESLELAQRTIQEIGSLIISEQWAFVQLCCMDLVSNCKTVVTRWADRLSVQKRNDIIAAQQVVVSLASEASGARIKRPGTPARKRLIESQANASDLISGALAEARATEERKSR